MKAGCTHGDGGGEPGGSPGKRPSRRRRCVTRAAEIGNRVWRDDDGDGVQDAGEPGIQNVDRRLLNASNTELATTTTAADGTYFFSSTSVVGLNPMTADGYKIDVPAAQTPLLGFKTTGEDLGTAGAGQDGRDGRCSCCRQRCRGSHRMVDRYRRHQRPQPRLRLRSAVSLGNRVWFDADNSGTLNGAEVRFANVTVKLFRRLTNGTLQAATNLFGTAVADATTDPEGFYRFDELAPAEYVVVIDKTASTVLDGYASSTGAAGGRSRRYVDVDDNGLNTPMLSTDVVPGGIASGVIRLGTDGPEPTTDTQLPTTNPTGESPNDHSNRSVDFGFTPAYSLGNRLGSMPTTTAPATLRNCRSPMFS